MRKLLITILFTSLVSLSLKAQDGFSSENGLFTINYLKGCAGTEVVVTPQRPGTVFVCYDGDPTNPESSENLACYNESANNPDGRLIHTYDQPGIYKVLMFKEDSPDFPREFDSLTVEIIDPQVPSISAINCNDDIIFDLNGSQESFDFYSIDFGD